MLPNISANINNQGKISVFWSGYNVGQKYTIPASSCSLFITHRERQFFGIVSSFGTYIVYIVCKEVNSSHRCADKCQQINQLYSFQRIKYKLMTSSFRYWSREMMKPNFSFNTFSFHKHDVCKSLQYWKRKLWLFLLDCNLLKITMIYSTFVRQFY